MLAIFIFLTTIHYGQPGTRTLGFLLDNHTSWELKPGRVSTFATSGSFTTKPVAVPAKDADGAAGVAQDFQGSTEGLVGVVVYDGPDGWKIVTYAQMPFKASEVPVSKACCD